jgi:hypothetical protein
MCNVLFFFLQTCNLENHPLEAVLFVLLGEDCGDTKDGLLRNAGCLKDAARRFMRPLLLDC